VPSRDDGAAPPLRVLHIVSGDVWGGAEAMVHDLTVAQGRRGVVEPACLLMNDGTLANALRKDGVAVTVVEESRLAFREILRRAGRLVDAWRPVVLHSHRTKEHVLAALLARGARRLGTAPRAVATIHGAPEFSRSWWDVRGRIIDSVERLALARFSAVVAVSEDLAVRFRAAGGTSMPLVVILNGINLERVREDARHPVPGASLPVRRAGEIRLVAVGRLVPVKRFERLCPLAELVATETGRPVTVLLAGDGPLRAALEAQPTAPCGSAQVVMLGFRTPVASVIASADALVMTSDHEGLPMVALEAAALDRPVFAFAVGGLKEIIGARVPGALAPAGDVALLARAIADAALGASVAPAGQHVTASSLLDVTTSAAAYEALYHEAVTAGIPALARRDGRLGWRA
jgi:glycosyltransferase involved in cell wall biosynthesis